MIHRFNEQIFQRMSPERRARKLSVMKALAKSVRIKNKENEDPLNNNMALPYDFAHSTPLKNQQVTDLDVEEPETEPETRLAESGEEPDKNDTHWRAEEEQDSVISHLHDSRDGRDELLEAEITVSTLEEPDNENEKHWRSLEVLHENAEYEFCRSLEESKLFVSTSSLLEEIEADLPSPYSLAKPLNHTFHTLSSYRTQTRLARTEGNATCPEVLEGREGGGSGGAVARKVESLEMEATVQRALAEQSGKALQLSREQKFFGVEHVESEKALLLANLRFNAAMQEARKLRLLGEVAEKDNFGQISISRVCFQVKSADPKSSCPEKYVCTATERENVRATFVASETVDGKLCFEEPLKFRNLREDFVIHVELFKLLNREPKKTMLTTALVKKLRKITTVNFNRSLTISPYSLSGFVGIAQCELRLSDVLASKKGNCTLRNRLTGVRQPLAGPEISLSVETDVCFECKQRGFLNVFKQTWHRRWYSLSGYFLESWLYPEDQESDKAPLDSVYLPDCASASAVGIEVCIRPHSFVITLKENAGEVLFSASSQKDMLAWVDQLNQMLEHIRLWKSNAQTPSL